MSVRKLLTENYVLDVELSVDKKTVMFIEECDRANYVDLTYAQLCEFIAELTAIAKEMVPTRVPEDPDYYSTFPD